MQEEKIFRDFSEEDLLNIKEEFSSGKSSRKEVIERLGINMRKIDIEETNDETFWLCVRKAICTSSREDEEFLCVPGY